MLLVTWNVNSIRVRLPRLLDWLALHQPDVLCLQEIKCQAPQFPWEALTALGYQGAIAGQKTYNGVALLAKTPVTDVQVGMGESQCVDDLQARVIAGSVAGIRVASVYVPNGQQVGSEKFTYKLDFLQRLGRYAAALRQQYQKVVIAGDFNCAPRESDVAKPTDWQDSVLTHDAVRQALAAALPASDWVDTVSVHHPEGGVYSWWDYRTLAFARNDGLRIDLIFASQPLAPGCQSSTLWREERKGKQPSDHIPVGSTFTPT